MNNTLKSGLAAATILVGGFSISAHAEGEYQYVAPLSYSNNIVGGGSTLVVNTGNPDAPVRVLHPDAVGTQMLGRGLTAVIGGGQDDYQTVVVPQPARGGSGPFAWLSGRSRG